MSSISVINIPGFHPELTINAAVIEASEALKKASIPTLYSMTSGLFELSKKVVDFVEPQSSTRLGFEITQLRELITYLRTNRSLPGVAWLAHSVTWFGESRALYDKIQGQIFLGHLDEFKILSNELLKVIAIQERVYSSKKDGDLTLQKLYDGDKVNLAVAKILFKKDDLRPEEAENAVKTFMEKHSGEKLHHRNTFTSTQAYEYDERFAPIFDASIEQLAVKGFTEEDLLLLARWNAVTEQFHFLRNIYLSTKTAMPLENYQIENLVEFGENFDRELEKVKDKLGSIKGFAIEHKFVKFLPLFVSLERLELVGTLSDFPEAVKQLKSLKNLKIQIDSSSNISQSIIDMKSLESLVFDGDSSLDFIEKMPNIKKVTFTRYPNQVFSPEVLEALKSRKDLILFNDNLNNAFSSIYNNNPSDFLFKLKINDSDTRTIGARIPFWGFSISSMLLLQETLNARNELNELEELATSFNQTAPDNEKIHIPDFSKFTTCQSFVDAVKELKRQIPT